MSGIAQIVSCLDGYDPNALRVDKAREGPGPGGPRGPGGPAPTWGTHAIT